MIVHTGAILIKCLATEVKEQYITDTMSGTSLDNHKPSQIILASDHKYAMIKKPS